MKNIIILFSALFLLACTKMDQGNLLITFVEQERDVEPYETRIIVTKKFLRFDDGEGAENFVLFDREKRIVYSVEHDESTVMAVHEKKFMNDERLKPPFKLRNSVKVFDMDDAPTVEGAKPVHYQLLTNNKACYDVIAAEGLLPEAVKALREFHTVMASDSATTFQNIPADLHNACDMTHSTFSPVRHLQFGFPIREWGKREYSRTLIDYKTQYEVDEKLFEFPQGFRHFTVEQLRQGSVRGGGH